MKHINLEHNLSDAELEDALKKALQGVQQYKEMDRQLPVKLANDIKANGEDTFGDILNNMFDEIRNVLLIK